MLLFYCYRYRYRYRYRYHVLLRAACHYLDMWWSWLVAILFKKAYTALNAQTVTNKNMATLAEGADSKWLRTRSTTHMIVNVIFIVRTLYSQISKHRVQTSVNNPHSTVSSGGYRMVNTSTYTTYAHKHIRTQILVPQAMNPRSGQRLHPHIRSSPSRARRWPFSPHSYRGCRCPNTAPRRGCSQGYASPQ
jgi:hypothetical protein